MNRTKLGYLHSESSLRDAVGITKEQLDKILTISSMILTRLLSTDACSEVVEIIEKLIISEELTSKEKSVLLVQVSRTIALVSSSRDELFELVDIVCGIDSVGSIDPIYTSGAEA